MSATAGADTSARQKSQFASFVALLPYCQKFEREQVEAKPFRSRNSHPELTASKIAKGKVFLFLRIMPNDLFLITAADAGHREHKKASGRTEIDAFRASIHLLRLHG
ncbi:hypothetical protein G6L37_24745 [Agrobacterium rubi]|uniref:hypothetical protein n=1 Tax=Agrobacterium rubi TaxID=28099 RepID=UPI0015729D93|nr:hypothetical protein [Agrobacterium rubi]NTF10205.1 hypothetical protein [Agrobacterium rubi]NTF21617.1 hypothetical protein [Agrobacterium rubi]NTF28474.1 hypothetical protein [Agrobacterium rubi]